MRTCMPRPVPILQMTTIVEQPFTPDGTGRIYCHPMGQEPIEFEWESQDGSEVAVNEYGNEAYDLPLGVYRVTAVDATGSRAHISVAIEAIHADAVVIRDYATTPASTSMSRDGAVEAMGTNLNGSQRFVWTNGAETRGPVLKDVPCGTYAAIFLPSQEEDASDDTPPPVFVHTASPAKVETR